MSFSGIMRSMACKTEQGISNTVCEFTIIDYVTYFRSVFEVNESGVYENRAFLLDFVQTLRKQKSRETERAGLKLLGVTVS